jgi:hypothetical protein
MAKNAELDTRDPLTLEAFQSQFDELFDQAEKRLKDLQAERDALDVKIREAEQLHTNIRNAQAALQGKWAPSTTASKERKPRAPSTRAPRGARAELRNQITELLRNSPQGLTAEGINSELQASSKNEKQRIANVLSAMKREGLIVWDGRRSPYKLAPAQAHEPPELASRQAG